MSQIAFAVTQDFMQNRLFDITSARDNCLERFVVLKQTIGLIGISCDTLDTCSAASIDVLVCSDITSNLREILNLIKLNSTIRILYLPTEPPVVSCLHDSDFLGRVPFDRVLFWNDEFARHYKHAVKCNIGQPIINLELIPFVDFNDKKFLSVITSSKLIKHENGIHKERYKAFEFFSKKPEGLELFGAGWEGVELPFVKTSYKGMCEGKKDVLKNYKFSICFENAKNYPGLITEKIFDCFAAGTVPIYYGPPNVQDYIPLNCFIDFCSFGGYEELYQFLVNMTEVEYQVYLDAAKAFIKSKEYYEFTSKRFAEIVSEQIQAVLKEPKPNRTVLSFKWSLFKIVLRNPLYFLKNLKQCRRFLFDLFFS